MTCENILALLDAFHLHGVQLWRKLQTGCADAFYCAATVKIWDVSDAFSNQFGSLDVRQAVLVSWSFFLNVLKQKFT